MQNALLMNLLCILHAYPFIFFFAVISHDLVVRKMHSNTTAYPPSSSFFFFVFCFQELH